MYLGAPLWFLQLLRDITKIGTSNTTVCVNTNGSYAVVYISAKQIITCSSCHKNQTSCKHVNCLLSVIESCSNTQEDLPNALELFADLVHSKDLESTTSDVHTFQPSHTSRKSIPFCLPESLTKVTSLPYLERFNLVDNVAHLIPTDTDTHCPKCVQAMWTSDVYFDHNATIVTNNQLFKAKGGVVLTWIYSMHKYILIHPCILGNRDVITKILPCPDTCNPYYQ